MGLRVLLIDDERDFADALAETLTDSGFEVQIASTGMESLDLARDMKPDVVLLDLGLPDADGHDIAKRMRADLPATTPIIVLTGRPQAGFGEHVDLLLNKPVPADLLGGLIEYMRNRRLAPPSGYRGR